MTRARTTLGGLLAMLQVHAQRIAAGALIVLYGVIVVAICEQVGR